MARALRCGPAIGAALVFLAAGSLISVWGQAGTVARNLTCYYIMEEGASADGNSLFMKKMGFDPELLRSYCPSIFSRGPTGFSARAQGVFSYQADSPVLVDRSGNLALYEVAVKLRSDSLPAARSTVTVTIDFADLRKGRSLVQPSIKAMDYASDKAGMKSGLAWIVSMKRVAPGKLEAVVGLSR